MTTTEVNAPRRADGDLDAAARRERLRVLLREEAILRSRPGAPVLGRAGETIPWMLYTPAVSLTPGGLELAASCLLDRLRTSFASTQLAVFGHTGVPLMTGCLVLGDGRYTGLIVREKPKEYGLRRRVEGPGDRSRPVVVLDDSLSAGTSFRKAARALEAEGYTVEGTLALVGFPYRGGPEWARAHGYRAETLLDIWDDLEMPRPQHVPGHLRVPVTWSTQYLPDGVDAATAARLVVRHWLATGEALRPPPGWRPERRTVNGAVEGSGLGGAWVSLRDRRTDERLARDGFWHFDPTDADPARDLVLAAVKTARSAQSALTPGLLDTLKVGVTFFGPLRQVAESELDFTRLGIAVRSRYWPTKVGGALPHTQVFTSEAEQLHHARKVNGGVTAWEPHELFVHEIDKRAEPGDAWPVYGSDPVDVDRWRDDAAIGASLTARAGHLLRAAAHTGGAGADGGTPIVKGLVPVPVDAIAVTAYDGGTLGCGVAWVRGGDLDGALAAAARGASRDRRWAPGAVAGRASTVVVTLLHDREWLGKVSVAKVGRKVRAGLDAMSVHDGAKQAVFVDSVVSYYDWTTEHAATQLLRKARIEGGSPTWFTYRTTTWAGPVAPDGRAGESGRAGEPGQASPRRLHAGFTRRDPREVDPTELTDRVAGFLHASIGPDGLPFYVLHPTTGTTVAEGSVARLAHALVTLAQAGTARGRDDWHQAGVRGLRSLLDGVAPDGTIAVPGRRGGRMSQASLLDAALSAGDDGLRRHEGVERLVAGVAQLLRPDGSLVPPGVAVRADADHDFLPGVALGALSRAQEHGVPGAPDIDWQAALTWYARRWRALHPWGLLAWHLQLWNGVHARTGDGRAASFVGELARWAIARQVRVTGAYLTDLATVPSFHTAFVAEGVADAASLAARTGDADLAAACARSWRAAIAWTDRLVIREEDTFALAAGRRAVGGVRAVEASSHLRIDYASHLLSALLKGTSGRPSV